MIIIKIDVSSGQAKLKTTSTPSWYNDSWKYRKKITIDRTKISGAQTNFPVLVQETNNDWKDTANGGSVGRADGLDFVFTSDDGTSILNYEIEQYNASTGELVAWVNIPSLPTATDTEFYVYYGNANATDQQSKSNVWDSNFKMVQHAKDSGQLADSTANGNDGTVAGNPLESYAITSVSPHTGSHQGVATDGSNYYTFDTDSITKYNSNWTQQAQLLNANQSIGVNTTNHLADGEYYNGELYVPVENYVHPCVSTTDNYLAVWNASDLSFNRKIDISGLGFSSAGLTIDPNAGDNGVIYNISYCDGTKIWKLDLSTGAYLGSINLSQPILNSQGISLKDGYFYIVDDVNDSVWKVAQDGTVLNSVLSFPHNASGSFEGIDYSGDKLLALIDQGVPDRKVYTFEKASLKKIGPALDFKKSESIAIPYTLSDSGTISMWYNPKNYFYNFHSLVDNSVSGNDWEMWIDSAAMLNFRVKESEAAVKYDLGDNTTQAGLNTWFHIVIKWQKNGNKTLLVNGVQRGTNSIATTWVNPGSTTYIGGGNLNNQKDNGYYDEIRISDVVRSNGWIATEYNNQNSPATFYTIGSQELPFYDTSDPTVQPTAAMTFDAMLSGFSEDAVKNGGEIRYQLSNDNGSTWYWYNSGWQLASSGFVESNVATDINAYISTFPIGLGQLLFKAYLHSDGNQDVRLDAVSIDSTSATVPNAATNLVATRGNAQVGLSWTAPIDDGGSTITDYVVQYKESGSSSWITFNDGTGANINADVTGLTNGTTYDFRVRAVNIIGESVDSSIASAKPATAPDVPSIAAIPEVTSVKLIWTAPSDGGEIISDYIVQFKKTSDSTWETFSDGINTNTALTVMGLDINTSYDFRVAAKNSLGSSFSSVQTVITLGNVIKLGNAEDNKPIMLITPEDANITCRSVIKEDALSEQDAQYGYPLGLVDFCFETTVQSNWVSLTFVTDLKPNQVVARKYDSTNSIFFDISNATITETTLDGKHALKLTYNIEDNGVLDLDPATGSIKDPVGLALLSSEGDLANTGWGVPFVLVVSIAGLAVGGGVLRWRLKGSRG